MEPSIPETALSPKSVSVVCQEGLRRIQTLPSMEELGSCDLRIEGAPASHHFGHDVDDGFLYYLPITILSEFFGN